MLVAGAELAPTPAPAKVYEGFTSLHTADQHEPVQLRPPPEKMWASKTASLASAIEARSSYAAKERASILQVLWGVGTLGAD